MKIQTTNRQVSNSQPQQKTSPEVKVEVFETARPSDTFVRTAVNTAVGAGEGLIYGAMSNSLGWAETTIAASVTGAVFGAYEGRQNGKALDKKLSEHGLPEEKSLNFARKQMVSGGLSGFSDSFAKTALITGMTQVTGGNVLVGVATGAVLGALDIF